MRPCCLAVLAVALFMGGSAAALPVDSELERLNQALLALPPQWTKLRPTRATIPQESLAQLFARTEESERDAMKQTLLTLFRTPVSARAEFIAQHQWTEIELWLPQGIATQAGKQSAELAARWIMVWLELAATQGRRDVLLVAAARGLQLVRLHLPASVAAATGALWVGLPILPGAEKAAAELREEHANVLFILGRTRESLAVHRESRALFQTHKSELGEASTWLGEADVHYRLGQSAQALDAYRRGRKLYQKLGRPVGEGNAWLGEAEVLFRTGRNGEARAAHLRARPLFQQGTSKRGEANTFRGEADTLLVEGRLGDALFAYRHARELFAQEKDHQGEAHTFTGEAKLLLLQGQIDKALLTQERARALFHEAGNVQGEATSIRVRAEALLGLGRVEESLEEFIKARALFKEASDLHGEASTWLVEANVEFAVFLNREARVAYEKARRLYRQIGDPQGEANASRGIAELRFWQGARQSAVHDFRRARTLYERASVTQGVTAAWRGEALVWISTSRWKQAARAGEQSLLTAQKGGDFAGELLGHLLLLECQINLHNDPAALVHAEAALPLINRMRARGITDEDRTFLSQNLTLPYEVLVSRYARDPERLLDAVRMAEVAHAPVLLDLLLHNARAASTAAESALYGPPSPFAKSAAELELEPSEEPRIHAELVSLDAKLAVTLDGPERDSLGTQRHARELQLNRLRLYAGLKSPPTIGSPLTDAERQALIDESSPILMYFAAPDELVAFLFTPGRLEPWVEHLPVSRAELATLAADLRGRLANRYLSDSAETVAKLHRGYDMLIAPFESRLAPYSRQRLTLIPHGPLHQLPFEALLRPDKQPVSAEWIVSMVPSLSILRQLRLRPRQTAPLPFALLAAGTGLVLPQPFMDQLTTFYGPGASEVRLQAGYTDYVALAPRARVLLLATHGYHSQSRREETYLELSLELAHDRRLRASEIAHLPLHAEVVVLAACETAKGEALLSDERLDLSRAFLMAGARAVIATRWRLPDGEATQQFLLDLHRLLSQGEGAERLRPDSALATARTLSRSRGAPAAVWGAFVLIGDAT